jgi:Flp pilus assembly protein TadD
MRLVRMLPVLVLCTALPAGADKKLDEAVAKAEQQLARGKPDEAVKVLQKAAAPSSPGSEAQLAWPGF